MGNGFLQCCSILFHRICDNHCTSTVIPAKAGILSVVQLRNAALDSGLRRNDGLVRASARRIAATFLCSVVSAHATNYQDLWYNAAESGWGIQIVQQEEVIFATWFIYDTAGKPIWVASNGVAKVAGTANPTYRGNIARATGTYFGAPTWTTFLPVEAGPAGSTSVTFTFTDAKTGTLVYTIDGVTVTKQITRQPLKQIDLNGFYYGGLSRNASGCTTGALNGSSAGNSTIQLTHTPTTGAITINETSGSLCRFTGTLQQFGSIFEGSGNYQCAGDALLNGTWTGREGTGGESTFSVKLSLRPANETCTVSANLGGIKQ